MKIYFNADNEKTAFRKLRKPRICWWQQIELNQRHSDFQSYTLILESAQIRTPELPNARSGHFYVGNM
jgi:hypothetical protein